MKLFLSGAMALLLPLIAATTSVSDETPVVPSPASNPNQVNDCSTSGCASGYVCAENGACYEDCHIHGCAAFHHCRRDGFCEVGKPPVAHTQCGSNEHYDPATDSCVPGALRQPPEKIQSRATSVLPPAGKTPVLSLEAICHVNLNGTSRCCSKSGDICISGEVEKSDQHVIIPLKHEL